MLHLDLLFHSSFTAAFRRLSDHGFFLRTERARFWIIVDRDGIAVG